MSFFKPMLAHTVEKYPVTTFPVYVQPKLDGVRMLWDGEHTWSRSGKPLTAPVSVEKILQAHWRDYPLDGELYHPTLDFERISGLARRLAPPDILQYWIYDTPRVGSFALRNTKLESAMGEYVMRYMTKNISATQIISRQFVLLPSHLVYSQVEIDTRFELWTSMGFEGLMVRDPLSAYEHKRTRALLKRKQWFEAEALIIELLPGKGKHEGRLGAFLIKGDGWTCQVGTGLSDAQREMWWQDSPIGRIARIKYQEKTLMGVPRFPVLLTVKET